MIVLNILVFVMRTAEDQTGKKFNHLTVMGKHLDPERDNITRWRCRCRCGKITIATTSMLRLGQKKSCGCARNECRITHGMTHSVEYKTWISILQRCHNPKNSEYHNYGGRGILVCARWLAFEYFYTDMGPRPAKGYSIERNNVNGHYDPDNCRWATHEEQVNNKRNNVRYEIDGFVKNITQLAKEVGLNRATVNSRLIRGATIEEALSKPLRKRK